MLSAWRKLVKGVGIGRSLSAMRNWKPAVALASSFLHRKGNLYIGAILRDFPVFDNHGLVYHVHSANNSHRFTVSSNAFLTASSQLLGELPTSSITFSTDILVSHFN